MGKLTKTAKAIAKTAIEIDELDLDAETAENFILPLLQAALTHTQSILTSGKALTDIQGDEDGEEEEEEDEDEDGEEEEEDEDEDGEEEEEDEDDDFADDEDEEEDEEEEDEDEDDEPAPKKKVKKPAAKAVSKKTPAKAAAKPAKKSGKSKLAAMGFPELKAHYLDADPKRAKAIATAVSDVGPRGKAAALLAYGTKKGW